MPADFILNKDFSGERMAPWLMSTNFWVGLRGFKRFVLHVCVAPVHKAGEDEKRHACGFYFCFAFLLWWFRGENIPCALIDEKTRSLGCVPDVFLHGRYSFHGSLENSL